MTQDSQKNHELLLDVRNMRVDYLAGNGTVHAVRDVSFTLGRGEIMGLAGESGSGKSTLAFAIARLLRPPAMVTGGQALYYPRKDVLTSVEAIKRSKKKDNVFNLAQQGGQNSIDVLKLTPYQLRAFRWSELSIVFQSAMNALNPVMNVGAQIIDVIKAHQPERDMASCRKRAGELLEVVGIAADRLKSYPHELSGGMRQRMIIAIALALQPELIIMDEPTTALDVVVQREILELISSLCRETGTSLIFITHDLSLLLELSDKIAVMYAGSLIEMASQNDLFMHPRHPYTYGLMNSFPTIDGPRRIMTGIPGSPPDLRTVSAGCPFTERCPFAFAPCPSTIPVFQQATPQDPEQHVACHLYNMQFNPRNAIPDASTFARGYEVRREGSLTR